MDNQRSSQHDLRTKFALQQDQFFKSFAKDYLAFLGNTNPSVKQVAEMQSVLSHAWIRQPICLDIRLTEREGQCLYLSAQGKSVKQIALFFNVSVRRVEQHRRTIFEKLACNNIIEAITIGVRYGKIRPLDEEDFG